MLRGQYGGKNLLSVTWITVYSVLNHINSSPQMLLKSTTLNMESRESVKTRRRFCSNWLGLVRYVSEGQGWQWHVYDARSPTFFQSPIRCTCWRQNELRLRRCAIAIRGFGHKKYSAPNSWNLIFKAWLHSQTPKVAFLAKDKHGYKRSGRKFLGFLR